MTWERGNQRSGNSASSSRGVSATGGARSAAAMAKWVTVARSSGGSRRKGWKPTGPYWAIQTEWAEHSGGLWEEDDEGLGPDTGRKAEMGWEVAAIGLMQRKTKEMVWAGKKVLVLKLSKE
jgi:hypothetical protein